MASTKGASGRASTLKYLAASALHSAAAAAASSTLVSPAALTSTPTSSATTLATDAALRRALHMPANRGASITTDVTSGHSGLAGRGIAT